MENTAHDSAAPMAVAQNGNIPAGWVSPSAHDAQQREIHRLAVLREMEDAAKAAVEDEVNRRMRGDVKGDVAHFSPAEGAASPVRRTVQEVTDGE